MAVIYQCKSEAISCNYANTILFSVAYLIFFANFDKVNHKRMKSNKRITVILADDDEDDRELLQSLFKEREEFELIGCFESGIDVIKEIMINKTIPDVLVIDMYMPMLNGSEIIKRIEDSEIAPDMTKFIFSTTINTTEQNKYHKNDSVKFLKKPATLSEINSLPDTILRTLDYSAKTKV